MSGYGVDLGVLEQVGDFVGTEEDYIRQISGMFGAAGDMLSMSIEGIDTGPIADGAQTLSTETSTLATAVADYGRAVGQCAVSYGASDADVAAALAAL